jgi:hypothetical protein
MPIPGTVQVTGPIAPTSLGDTYPSHEAIFGLGGLRTVAAPTGLNAIPDARREQGMIAFTQSDGNYWQLNAGPWTGTSADWTLLNFGASGSDISGSLNVGANVIDSYPVASIGSVVWELTLVKAGNRYCDNICANTDGVNAYDAHYGTVLGPNQPDVTETVDVNGGNLRLVLTAASSGWGYRLRRRTSPA